MNKSLIPRQINLEKDYETLFKWWELHKWPPVPIEVLPSYGLIIDDLCAGFLYQTDSSLAWLEWIISNPDSDAETRNRALDILCEGLKMAAIEMGFKCIITTSSRDNLIKRLTLNHDFQVSETATILVRRL